MTYRLPPGPAGTSCLTCKRRHKKCDRRKPICERCAQGGYQCLGYGNNKSADYIDVGDEPPRLGPVRQPGSNHVRPESSSSSASPRSSSNARSSESPILGDTAGTPDVPDTYVEHLIWPNVSHPPRPRHEDPVTPCCTTVIQNDTRFTPPESQAVVAVPTLPRTTDTSATQVADLSSDTLLFALASQIPQGLPLPPDVRETAEYVMSRLDRILGVTYFKPQGKQIARFLGHTAWRLSTCDFARRGLLIYAKIRDSILEGSDSGNEHMFVRWIEGHEQVLSNSLDQSLTPYEQQERHHDILEVFYVKVAVFNATTTYRLMCYLAPNFLQTVYSDPTLWPRKHNPALVSIAHLLSSPRYGPMGYALMDVMASMMYGVPHLVEYNTDVEPFHTQIHPAEWMNCFPGEFLILLARINICRDRDSSAEDWRDIEQRLVSWEPRRKLEPEGLDSSKSVAWLALQETWRHALLLYLYLALYGAPTDDPRIQTSSRQIFQILAVIGRQDPPVANVHFPAQYLLAGICSHTEKRRRLVRERLGCAAETRFWAFHGSDIVPILDHLWLGAGIGGRPVTWNDYVHSRHSMLPLFS
ncbi:hypothetical protein RSOLAG1IB_06450 [Rhizoctonia solani AG-1 IB]|uniref:Zn(2)-C6 fungal-type domain-containing protein n=1 Tax=Thanatephorus cucumeris (strain AG1-IB / isolate 7/3/14) TaxID=1108050 RepID=A0A0B7F7U6_THACB|nr:hypothetical protein RSOLAG1IB_06450 [Rhizoctonia solani AG-1 IB]